MVDKVIESIDLYFTEGSSDKVYKASIVQVDGGCHVEFQYGRRGSTLKSGRKTSNPVDIVTAENIYRKLVAEKTGKGYTRDVSGEIYVGMDDAGSFSGYKPQLLNPVTEEEALSLLETGDWLFQEKKDGERQFLIFKGGRIFGTNRDGIEVPIPQSRVESMQRWIEKNGSQRGPLAGETVIDGESIGEYYYAFDILKMDGEDLRDRGFGYRFNRLDISFINMDEEDSMRLVPAHYTANKTQVDQLRNENAEGFVIKHMHAPYSIGRPSSGGDQLKFKFYDELTIEVSAINEGKRSVQMQMVDGETGSKVDVGNLTIPENRNMPSIGDFIDVRYLYANPGGSLIQPVYSKPRPDKHMADEIGEIKIKRDEQEYIRQAGRRMRP